MCAVRSKPVAHRHEGLPLPPYEYQMRRMAKRRPANDNRTRTAGVLRAATALTGAAVAGCAALALALARL